MVYWLLETCLVNAVVASLLAVGVVILGRYIRRPALLHALWILVLVKLITPPLVELPVGFRLEPLAQHDPLGDDALLANAASTPSDATTDESASTLGGVDPNHGNSPVAESDAGAMPTSSSAASGESHNATWLSRLEICCGVSMPAESVGRTLFASAITFWLTGTAIWFLVIAWRLVRFSRFLRGAPPAPSEINIMARRLAATLNVPRTPDVRVVDSRFSPMLWAALGGPKIILPKPLIDRLDPAAIESLLVHELAHYRRRDYLVRVLEIVATGLFWWHPVVWLARNRIETNEEQCCDAWVVDHLAGRPRPYAEALLATIDFLAEGGAMRLAPGATGLGDARIIRQRMQMIFTGMSGKAMSDSVRRAVVTASILVLAVGPQVFAKAADRAIEAIAEKPDSATEPFEPKAVEVETIARKSTKIPMVVLPMPSLPPEPAYEVPPAEPFTSEVSSWARASSHQGRLEIVARTDRTALLIDHARNEVFDMTRYGVSSAAFSPDEAMVALGSTDGAVNVIDCATGELVASFSQPQSEVRTVAFTPDGKLIAAGTEDGRVHLLEVASQAEVTTIATTTAAINSVRFSLDGQLLAVSSGSWLSPSEGELLLWNVISGEVESKLVSGAAQGIAGFSEDNQLIAAEWDGSITLYDLTTSQVTNRLQIEKNLVAQAGFSPSNEAPLVAAVADALEQQVMHSQLPVRINYGGQWFNVTGDEIRLVVPELQ